MLKTKKSAEQILFIFLGIWTLINIIQAAFVEVHADEAYYWMYSRFLDWGYFDHPPMVALFMRIGDALLPNTLGLRIFSVITSTLSVYLLWQIVKPYAQNIRLFILLFLSVVLFHVYGVITTPDSPLLFFIILFFYVYQRYVAENKLKWAFFLALVIACMLYSKYHGILVLFFTILSNWKLLKRPSFWLIVFIVILAFAPHIWWQIQNNYPSFYYHVIDRSAAFYKTRFTIEYLVGELLLAGPLVGWFLYRSAVLLKTADSFVKALKFNFYGIFIFFLLSTLKGGVEAHWTLPGMICLFILAYLYLATRPVPKWFERLAMVNIALIILARLIIIFPIGALKNVKVIAYYFGNKEWAMQIHEKAGDAPVIFKDSFQLASRYNYYTRSTKGFSHDSRYYRKNQYDLWPLEDSLRNKRVYYVLPDESHGSRLNQDTLRTPRGLFYGRWIDDVRMYQKVTINPVTLPAEWKRGALIPLQLLIENPYDTEIFLGSRNQQWGCYLEYSFKNGPDIPPFESIGLDPEIIRIGAKGSMEVTGSIRVPSVPGKYKLILSIRTSPFEGSRSSNMISVEVK